MLSLWPFPSIIIQYIEFTYPNDCCHESTIDTKLAKHNHCECNYYFSSGWSCTHINSHHHKSLRRYTSLLSMYMFQVHIWARCFDQGETSLIHANSKVDVVSLSTSLLLFDTKTPRESLHQNPRQVVTWTQPRIDYFLSIGLVTQHGAITFSMLSYNLHLSKTSWSNHTIGSVPSTTWLMTIGLMPTSENYCTQAYHDLHLT